MGRDLSIADRCRTEGLRVSEVDGWRDRGSSDFNPRGSVCHHTADGPNGSAPSLDGIIHGFSGSASGPLAQVMQSREPDGNDVFYIVAAGRANHAGEGGWRGLSGNSSVIGLEVEHTGTDPLPEGRQRLAARFHAAMARGRWDASMVCQHKEWAPGRKIDCAENVDGDQFRGWVAEALSGGGGPPKRSRLLEVGVFLMFGPGGAALVGAGYMKNLTGEEYDRATQIPGIEVMSVDQRGWDVIGSVCMNGNSAPAER